MKQWEWLYTEAVKKLKDYVEYYKIPLDKVCLLFSGGRDSTIMLNMIEELGWKNQIKVVFCNTMMEFDATIDFINQKRNEGWIIEETKPQKNHIQVYREYGYPLLSKNTSEMIYRLQQHNFDFLNDTYKTYDELILKYPKCSSALRWLSRENVIKFKCPKWLKRELVFLNLKISNKCCDYLKKKPVKDYNKENGIILSILGVRKSEGINREAAYKSCVWTDGKHHKFFPLLYFTDNDIRECVADKQIKLSDVYEKYGMERGGCVGCPFSKNYKKELDILKEYEPKRYLQTQAIYKDIYALKDKKYQKKTENKENNNV